MRKITVNYLLSEEEEKRLENITEEYKKQGLDLSLDKQFEYIMRAGCKYDIDNKFQFHEFCLGLREAMS